MTDYKNAERLREKYLACIHRKTVVNVCTARRNWNGCDYCDVYSGSGCEYWKQDGKHNCVHVLETPQKEVGA